MNDEILSIHFYYLQISETNHQINVTKKGIVLDYFP